AHLGARLAHPAPGLAGRHGALRRHVALALERGVVEHLRLLVDTAVAVVVDVVAELDRARTARNALQAAALVVALEHARAGVLGLAGRPLTRKVVGHAVAVVVLHVADLVHGRDRADAGDRVAGALSGARSADRVGV